MKKAVSYLLPFLEAEKVEGEDNSPGKILLATVKGDVHDIGKNIVGVVLGCNNYEIVDLGVMVPVNKIIEEAKNHNVDVIGLSGLITPSLEEMVDVAVELEKAKCEIPLLIGGATTSKPHTAVKIDEKYNQPVIHVLDASKAVTVVDKLLGEKKTSFVSAISEEYEEVRAQFKNRQSTKSLLSIEEARKNKVKINWEKEHLKKPNFEGVKHFLNYDLQEISTFIDWTPFFQTWELAGKFPSILEDDIVGEEASKVYEDAQTMLARILEEKWLSANASVGIWPAVSNEDDVEIITGEEEKTVIHFLRQQGRLREGNPNRCLSDFVAPKEAGKQDYLGAFIVTSGLGIERRLKHFEADHDDYSSIMLKALADRLAEAFAELMHHKLRTELWGYSNEEHYSNEDLIREKYTGIRPAPGYPACPEHTEKEMLFSLLDPDKKLGVNLTENMAMYPAASVSGFYFANPNSRYFNVGKIGKDQVEDYSKRKQWSVETGEKWLRTVLNY